MNFHFPFNLFKQNCVTRILIISLIGAGGNVHWGVGGSNALEIKSLFPSSDLNLAVNDLIFSCGLVFSCLIGILFLVFFFC